MVGDQVVIYAGYFTRPSTTLHICWRQRPPMSPFQALAPSWPAAHLDRSYKRQLPFVYQPLPSSKDAIRLIELHPVSDSGVVVARMVNAVLSETPFYHALSYMWGPADETHTIILNGRPIKIRKNLFHFLTTWSKQYSDRKLWIDALCINQDDVRERNRQVTMMGDIYKTATSVLLWLGPNLDGSKQLFQYLIQNGRCARQFSRSEPRLACPQESLQVWSEAKPRGPAPGTEHKDALTCLLHREYWSRAWIIQELVLARDITIHCGDQAVSWSCLRALDKKDSWSHLDSPLDWSSCFNDTVIRSIFEHLFEHRELELRHSTLGGMFKLYPARKCADPRDQIYSLLSLDDVNRDRETPLRVDYDIDLCNLLLNSFANFGPLRDAKSFEELRKSLGVTWSALLLREGSDSPRTRPYGAWHDNDHPWFVYTQVEVRGTLDNVDLVSKVPGGSVAVQYFGNCADGKQCRVYGYAHEAQIGDQVFRPRGTRLNLIFRFTDGGWTFVSPVVEVMRDKLILTAAKLAERGDFDCRIYQANVFNSDNGDITLKVCGAVLARFNLRQWSIVCRYMIEDRGDVSERGRKVNGMLPEEAWGSKMNTG